ncbi:MAG TPA: glycosyltransferase family 9 protein [Ktedonobacterales bacterium]
MPLPDRARILVIKAAGIGDLLLAVPSLLALRARYPRATLDVLVTPQAAELMRNAPYIDHVLVVDKAPFDDPGTMWRSIPRLASVIRLARRLRANRYDAALLLHHLTLPFGRLKYRMLLAAARPALRVGLENGHGSFLDVHVPDAGFGARHEAEYCADVAAAVGAGVLAPLSGPSLADLGWESDPDPATAPAPAPNPAPLVALSVGSGTYSVARRWPLERFMELARRLHDELGARVAIIAGPDERDLAREASVALEEAPWVVAGPGGDGLRETAQFLARCQLVVGNDSLPTHLAAAAGTPVVAIFGPSNARAWKPLAREPDGYVRIIRRDLACSPCFYRGHSLGTPQGCPARWCLTGLDVDPVFAAARTALLRRDAIGASART